MIGRSHDPVSDDVVVVDSEDRALGRIGKLQAHLPPGVRHRAFSMMVYDDGVWLLQRRASTKYHFAGLWSNTCCSHPRPDEDVLRASQRRLYEELGMTATGYQSVGRFEYVADDPVSGLIEHELVHVITAQAGTVPCPAEAEVDEVRWIAADELIAEVALHPSSFTPWLSTVLSLVFAAERSTPSRGGT